VRLALGADPGRVVHLLVGEDAQRIVLGVLTARQASISQAG
jgi:hypothetical protein